MTVQLLLWNKKNMHNVQMHCSGPNAQCAVWVVRWPCSQNGPVCYRAILCSPCSRYRAITMHLCQLQGYRKRINRSLWFETSQSGKTFVSAERLQEHKANMHSVEKVTLTCRVCKKDFQNGKIYKRHSITWNCLAPNAKGSLARKALSERIVRRYILSSWHSCSRYVIFLKKKLNPNGLPFRRQNLSSPKKHT